MKIVLVLLLCICVCCILGGCGKLELPEEPKIAADMIEYYSSKWYSRATQTDFWAVMQRPIRLEKISDISVIETDLNQKDKTAYVKCIITAGTDDLEVAFSKIDTWELFYSFQEGRWNLTQKNCLETQYELLSDLTEETCAFLLNGYVTFIEEVNSVLNGGDWITEEYIFQSVTTDRSAKSAVAVYRHISSPTFEEAKFIWTPEIGWSIDDEIASGTCGDNLTWKLNSNGLLTISGKGKIEDCEYPDRPWEEYHESITIAVIEDGVTSIGEDAFFSCSNLKNVIIPNSVTSIGRDAFGMCDSLVSVDIPDSVISIGEHAFSYCRSLVNVDIPDSVTSIGSNAFGICPSLTSVTIGDGVTGIVEYTFVNCPSLTSVIIGDSVTSIGGSAFGSCASLTSVTIPESVTSIDIGAFGNCSSLTSIVVASGNPAYSSIDGVLFNSDQTLLHTYPAGKTNSSYNIPESVISIGDFAFQLCSSLVSVAIPDSVISIGDGTFQLCNSLVSITIPDSVTSIGEGIFFECDSLTDIYYSGSEAQWNRIAIGNYNYSLFDATIHYNS